MNNDFALTRRELLAAGAAALPLLSAGSVFADEPARTSLGIVIHSYSARPADKPARFGEPLVFLEHCRSIGAGGGQISLGNREDAYAAQVREFVSKHGLFVEGNIGLPRGVADVERFAGEVRTAKACGAAVIRTALLSGRRYETFDTFDAFAKFAAASWDSLSLAKPVVEREGIRFAVENHKDWRASELVALLKRLDSPQFGVCLDTGNSIALIEEPTAVVEALAPLAFTTHLKDMGVEEYAGGFRLSEVPLGKGFLDLSKIVQALRRANPKIRFNLEMITRDPLEIPCLTPKYWATMTEVPAAELAATLAMVRKHAWREPLPRTAGLNLEERIRREDDNIHASLLFAREKLGMSV